MERKLLTIGLGVACLLLGENEATRKVQVGKTEKLDFPAGGTWTEKRWINKHGKRQMTKR